MIFDGHGDIWTHISRERKKGRTNVLRTRHLDRFKKGKMLGGIFVVFTNTEKTKDPGRESLEIIRDMSIEIIENQDRIKIVKTPRDFDRALDENKLAVVIGMEGLSGIGEDVDLLYPLYLLGLRHASLTWNEENLLATGARGSPKRGLTKKGIEAVKIMEELGILIDTAHTNDKTFWDIYENTEGIIIDTHSNARDLCDHPRNLTREQIKAIVERGGIIGLNSFHEFVHRDKEKRNVDYFIKHLDYLVDLVGIDHVAFGFDFFHYLTDGEDRYDYAVKGLQKIEDAPRLLDKLAKRGYSQEDIEKISYKNFYRVIKRGLKDKD